MSDRECQGNLLSSKGPFFLKKTQSLQKQNTLKIPLDFTPISMYNVQRTYTPQLRVSPEIYNKIQKGIRENSRFFTLKLCDLVY